MAIEREGVIETRVEHLSGRDPVLSVPITAAHAPNVYVSVLAVRGRLREVPWYSLFVWGWRAPLDWHREWRAAREAGGRSLAATATVDLARPASPAGGRGTGRRIQGRRGCASQSPPTARTCRCGARWVSIQVRDAAGRPAPAGAEVALAVVDQALLRLQPNASWKLLEAMMQRRAYGVETATARSAGDRQAALRTQGDGAWR